MALIKCPQCGHDVSTKAVKCPHCGCSLGKATVIQHGNGIDTKILGSFVQIVLAIIVAFGGVMCILPLFTQIFSKSGVPACGNFYFITYVLFAFSLIAAALILAFVVRGIVRLCKGKVYSLKQWGLASLFAFVSVLLVWVLVIQNDEAQKQVVQETTDAAKGTYQCQLQDGATLTFSACENGFCELKLPDGTVKEGTIAGFGYIDEPKEFIIEAFFQKDGVEYGSAEDNIENRDFREYTCSADMTSLYDVNGDYGKALPLKKISAETKTEKEYRAQLVETKAEKTNAVKNTNPLDLSAFMLHGKVKRMIEFPLGANSGITYVFNENGELTDVDDGHPTIIHSGNELRLSYDDSPIICYRVDDSGRLASYYMQGGVDVEKREYSDFNSHGWPTRANVELYGDPSTKTIRYSELDKYGNWTKMRIDDDDAQTWVREIYYYPE